jgi:hypothetical protein
MKLTKILGAILPILLIASTVIGAGKGALKNVLKNNQSKVTVQILAPTANQHETGSAFVISGTATAKNSIAGVFYQLNADDWANASLFNGGKSWSAAVSLDTGTNTLRVYARDSAGNVSSTNTVKFFYDTAPKSVVGLTAFVTNDLTSFVLSFGTNTFSMGLDDDFDGNGVGSYTYSKLNSSAGKVMLTFKAPPTLANSRLTLTLQFTTNDSGWFTNGDDTDFFTLDSDSLVPTDPLDTVVFDDDGGGETVLVFPQPSTILDNGHLFNVKNPFPIPLDAPYPGQIGDRVSVDLAHYGFSLNNWNYINSVKDSGTVLSFGPNSGGTDTVTVLFDIAPFVSSKDAFIPLAGGSVNVLTFFYTNTVDGTVSPGGEFTYKNYSPIGALLTTDAGGSTNFYILTFTDTGDGNYIFESLNPFNESSGTFNLTSSFNGDGGGDDDLTPATVTGKTLMTTNSGGFFESVEFLDDMTFTETNSLNIMTNSSGDYFYTSNSLDAATVELDFTNGPTTGFTNFIYTTFTNNDSGTFHTDMLDDSGNTNNSVNGEFILQP